MDQSTLCCPRVFRIAPDFLPPPVSPPLRLGSGGQATTSRRSPRPAALPVLLRIPRICALSLREPRAQAVARCFWLIYRQHNILCSVSRMNARWSVSSIRPVVRHSDPRPFLCKHDESLANAPRCVGFDGPTHCSVHPHLTCPIGAHCCCFRRGKLAQLQREPPVALRARVVGDASGEAAVPEPARLRCEQPPTAYLGAQAPSLVRPFESGLCLGLAVAHVGVRRAVQGSRHDRKHMVSNEERIQTALLR